MTRKPIEIKLQYLRAGQRREQVRKLSEDDYFDPGYRLAGRDAILSLPRHQHAWKYLAVSDGIVSITVTLVDKKRALKRVVATSYWDDKESELTEVVDYAANGLVKYRELILAQKLSIANMAGWLIERLEWSRTHWTARSAAFVEQRDDGTQRDHPIVLRSAK